MTAIAVGRPVTRPPPHRSRRAVFSHRALQTYSLPHGGLSHQDCLLWPWPPNNPWAGDLAVLEYFFVAVPVVATSLATPIEPLHQNTYGSVKELLKTGRIPVHSVVVGVPTKLASALLKQHAEPQMPVLCTPRREALESVPSLRARGAAFARRFARPLLAPLERKPQKLEPGWRCAGMSTAWQQPCLVP